MLLPWMLQTGKGKLYDITKKQLGFSAALSDVFTKFSYSSAGFVL